MTQYTESPRLDLRNLSRATLEPLLDIDEICHCDHHRPVEHDECNVNAHVPATVLPAHGILLQVLIPISIRTVLAGAPVTRIEQKPGCSASKEGTCIFAARLVSWRQERREIAFCATESNAVQKVRLHSLDQIELRRDVEEPAPALGRDGRRGERAGEGVDKKKHEWGHHERALHRGHDARDALSQTRVKERV